MRIALFKHFAWVGCLAAAATLAPSSQAASITAQLTCSLNVLGGGCDNVGPYGTVTLDDSAADGTLKISVTLGNPGQKFKDLVLAFDGAATSITENDPINTVVLNANAFTISPYTGAFDIGDSTTQHGWNGDSGYMAILSGDANLLLTDFLNAKDTLGKVSVALHIQDIGSASGEDCDGSGTKDPCDPTMTGPGSLKIGGLFRPDGDIPEVPEPSTVLLMGGALLGLGLLRKKRNG